MVLTDVAALADTLADHAATALERAIDPVVRQSVSDAVRAWPVRTGLSRASFRLQVVRLPSGEVTWRIRNPVGYSGAIFDRKLRPALTSARLLVVPIRDGIRRATETIEQDIRRGPR